MILWLKIASAIQCQSIPSIVSANPNAWDIFVTFTPISRGEKWLMNCTSNFFFLDIFFNSSPVAANKPQRYKTFFFFIRKKSTVNCTTESRDGESNDLMCFFFLEILIRYDGFIALLIDNGQSCWVWLIGVSNDSGVGCQFVLWQAINYENI